MLEEHLGYLSDRVRIQSYEAAVGSAVKSGDVVVDLGCGTGVLGLLCLRAGANRVYAIDSSKMLEAARQTFGRSGVLERATFVAGLSHRVELPERADVVICDHVGFFGFDYGILKITQDARKRFLTPRGNLIPSRIRLELGAVESQLARKKVDGWEAEAVPPEFHWLRTYAINCKYPLELAPNALLGEPATLADLDLRRDNPEFFSWTAELRIERAGIMHGLGGWFRCELADNIFMTNSPLSKVRIRRPQAFLPIEKSVRVACGDLVKATIMARPDEDLIAWTVELPAYNLKFSHSTWQGLLLAPPEVTQQAPDRVPRLSREGRARAIVLGYCDGRRTKREIELAILNDHPDLFPTPEESARFLRGILGRYSE